MAEVNESATNRQEKTLSKRKRRNIYNRASQQNVVVVVIWLSNITSSSPQVTCTGPGQVFRGVFDTGRNRAIALPHGFYDQ
jgi:hypothetical protein